MSLWNQIGANSVIHTATWLLFISLNFFFSVCLLLSFIVFTLRLHFKVEKQYFWRRHHGPASYWEKWCRKWFNLKFLVNCPFILWISKSQAHRASFVCSLAVADAVVLLSDEEDKGSFTPWVCAPPLAGLCWFNPGGQQPVLTAPRHHHVIYGRAWEWRADDHSDSTPCCLISHSSRSETTIRLIALYSFSTAEFSRCGGLRRSNRLLRWDNREVSRK